MLSNSLTWAADNVMSTAAAFSSRYLRRFVPGIGSKSSPLAKTQASASWAWCRANSSREFLHFCHQFQVASEVLSLKARTLATVVVSFEILGPDGSLSIRARACNDLSAF
jgi:hypothetical protein